MKKKIGVITAKQENRNKSFQCCGNTEFLLKQRTKQIISSNKHPGHISKLTLNMEEGRERCLIVVGANSKIDKKDNKDLRKTAMVLKEAFQKRYVSSIRGYHKPRIAVLTKCKYYRKKVFSHYYSFMLRAYDTVVHIALGFLKQILFTALMLL